MQLATRLSLKTIIPDGSIQSILGSVIYRIIVSVPKYGYDVGDILMFNAKNKQFSHYRSIDEAARAIMSAHGGYGYKDSGATAGELQKLVEWQALNMQYVWLLLDWSTMTNAERIKYELKCLEMASGLKGVRDEHKLLIRKWTAQASTVIDSCGQVNPNRTSLLHGSAARRGRIRADNVLDIAERFDVRLTALIRARTEVTLMQAYAEKTLERVVLDLSDTDGLSAGTAKVPAGLNSECTDLRGRLFACRDRPWFHSTGKTTLDIQRAQKHLVGDGFREAYRLFNIAFVSVRGLREYDKIAQFNFQLTKALSRKPKQQAELEYLYEELRALRDSLNGMSSVYRTQLMMNVRKELDGALAEWRVNDMTKVKKRLQKAGRKF